MLGSAQGAALMALFTRNFVLLWQGQLVSQLGNHAFLVATTYFTLEATGSATLVAAAMMASTVPVAIVSPFGGTLADRHSRRAILVATDLIRALAVGGLALFVIWRPDVTPRHVALVIAVAALNGLMGALFAPALQAMIPDLVPGDRLAAANSVNQISSQASMFIGQASGGVLYAAWGAAGLLLFDALSFVYGGVATSFLPPDRKVPQPRVTIRLALQQYAVMTREGMAYVWRRRGMTALLMVFAGVNCLFMPVFVLLPFYVREVLGGGPEWYGFLLGGSGAGALVGSVAAGILLTKVPRAASLIRICVGGVACCVLLVAGTRLSWMALAAFTTIGALSSIINVTVITSLQSAVPSDVRGRVMALVITLSTAAVPLGMAVGGVMGDRWRGSLPLVFAGCGAAIAILVAVSWQLKGFSEVLDHRASPRAR
jgi:DHA3 family macrolide efflux protein-like MFS transporter